MIIHEPIFDTQKIIEHYTEKDGVDIKYVCTSAIGYQDFAVDIFYRETPHPQFGNRYFGIYRNMFAAGAQIMITNADKIEDFDFGMIEDSKGDLHYSAHRHDYKVLDNGNMIDGGRAYIKSSICTVRTFRVVNGSLIEHWPNEDSGVEGQL